MVGDRRDRQKGWKWYPSVKNELGHYCVGQSRIAFESSHCSPHPDSSCCCFKERSFYSKQTVITPKPFPPSLCQRKLSLSQAFPKPHSIRRHSNIWGSELLNKNRLELQFISTLFFIFIAFSERKSLSQAYTF